jgi:ParB family chromosome partitioning protein
MKLDFIDLGKLSVSKANMRYAKKAPDVSDILPTVRARGVIMPLIVRPSGEADMFEIVAGSRRFHAAMLIAEERRGPRDRTLALCDHRARRRCRRARSLADREHRPARSVRSCG